MEILFDKINEKDTVFEQEEYKQDSVVFHAIESARFALGYYSIFSDHKDVIIMFSAKKGSKKVWIWTSSAVCDDTQKIINICRFLNKQDIPKPEIYIKEEISASMSDLYAVASGELNYEIQDEYSLRIFGLKDGSEATLQDGDKIVELDTFNEENRRLLTDFYRSLSDEFHWTHKFDRKLREYFDLQHFALINNGEIISNAAVGGATDRFLRIKSLATLEDLRNRGFAFKVLQYTSAKILESGKRPILYSHIGNKPAMALWSKAGYSPIGKLCLLKVGDKR